MGRGDTFGFYQYTSDDGTNYAIKLSANVAGNGGFGTSVDPRAVKVWPYHAKNMRHVLGKGSGTTRTRLPCATATQALYVSGGTFTQGLDTYVVEGAIGEKRKLNSVS